MPSVVESTKRGEQSEASSSAGFAVGTGGDALHPKGFAKETSSGQPGPASTAAVLAVCGCFQTKQGRNTRSPGSIPKMDPREGSNLHPSNIAVQNWGSISWIIPRLRV